MPQLNFGIYGQGADTEAQFGKLSISGEDAFGFRPFFLMTSAVAGCATGVLRRELSARGVEYDDIKVVADVTRNPAIANRIEQIDLEFRIKPRTEVSGKSIQEAIDRTLETSSMVQTVKESIKVTGRYSLLGAA